MFNLQTVKFEKQKKWFHMYIGVGRLRGKGGGLGQPIGPPQDVSRLHHKSF
jgi:hypothetical protein